MLEEKKSPDYVDAERLGKTFDENHLVALYKKLDDAELPIIPYNASIDELNRLVEHVAANYAYVQDSFGLLKIKERKWERVRQRAYNEAYLNAEKRMAGATQTVLKMVAETSKEVKKADDALDEIRNRIDIVDSRLKAFNILDQDISKLLSSAIEAMSKRMD